MPLSRYSRYFNGDAERAMRELQKQYGPEKGRSVFYALVEKRRKRQDSKGRANGLRQAMRDGGRKR